MTLVDISRQEFDLLDDERLGWACMEPTFLHIRGKDMTVKAQAISQLTKGQQALCMFRVMYDHVKNSKSEFYGWLSYLLGNESYWTAVTGALSFFDDIAMHQLLEQTKEVLEERNLKLGLQWSDAALRDLEDDPVLFEAVSGLFERFEELAPATLRRIATHIRENSQQFVSILS